MDSPVSGAWLYNGVADLSWAQHINSEDLQTFRRNGFYSTLVRPGLRIISINTNFCAGENFFLLLGFADPAGQLAWLAEELLRSEEAGEKVHILGHHPLHSCLEGRLTVSHVKLTNLPQKDFSKSFPLPNLYFIQI